jgi:homoserine dehydrogenase
VTAFSAILNATSNAVLSQMESDGCDIDEAIASACANGYTEIDPSLDLDGSDAAAKLVILCALAFHLRVDPDAIETRTTGHIGLEAFKRAHLRGGTIRQIAHASYDASQSVLTAWVAPIVVANASLFAQMTGPQNAAVITCAHAGDIMLTGQGAGGDAPAVAILGDVSKSRATGSDRARSNARRTREIRDSRNIHLRRPCDRPYRTAVPPV